MQMSFTTIATVTEGPKSRQVGDSITTRFKAQVRENWLGQNNEWQSKETDFVVQVWNGLATRVMNKGLNVDEKVFIEGSVDVNTFTDRDGVFQAPILVRGSVVRSLGPVEDSDFLKVQAIGHLGGDPEMRYTNRGDAVTNFRIAMNRNFTDAAGEKQEEASWFNISCFGTQAENCNTYLLTGSMVQITGNQIEADTWKGQDGSDNARLAVTARRVDFLGRSRAQEDGQGGATPATANEDAAAGADDDDDLPW